MAGGERTRSIRDLSDAMDDPAPLPELLNPGSDPSAQAVGAAGASAGYFGNRAAPLGAVFAGVVAAVFYRFAPQMAHRHVPAVWGTAVRRAAVVRQLQARAGNGGVFWIPPRCPGRSTDRVDQPAAGQPVDRPVGAVCRVARDKQQLTSETQRPARRPPSVGDQRTNQ